ncbi:hypothetical protein DRP04_11615 [Archaeoglobales archaeon]|nr:MAG: hypothetical protein DRP04_11615 [Archaeoglobales archaeon]
MPLLNLTKAQDALQQGDLIASSYYVWDAIFEGYFLVILFMILEFLLYIKTEGEELPMAFALIFASVCYMLLPWDVSRVVIIAAALVLTFGFMNVLVGRPK